MTHSDDSCASCKAITESLNRLRKDIPNLKVIADSFENLFLQIAALKESIPLIQPHDSEIDVASFVQGVPILKNLEVDAPRDLFLDSANSIIPAMQKCFPGIGDALEKFLDYVRNKRLISSGFMFQDQAGSSKMLDEMAKDLGLQSDLITFIMSLVSKPFAERISESLTPLPESLIWKKGYCPICGSWPEVSFIRGHDGKRSLRCSFCGHEWGFSRLLCPFCENDDQTKLELFYSEDRSFERAELCQECKKYIVSLDTRNMASDPAPEVAALGMIYLDVLAQEKGFTPGAICTWNVIQAPKNDYS